MAQHFHMELVAMNPTTAPRLSKPAPPIKRPQSMRALLHGHAQATFPHTQLPQTHCKKPSWPNPLPANCIALRKASQAFQQPCPSSKRKPCPLAQPAPSEPSLFHCLTSKSALSPPAHSTTHASDRPGMQADHAQAHVASRSSQLAP